MKQLETEHYIFNYGKGTPAELNQDFVSYVKLFQLDTVLEDRMAQLLSEDFQ